MRLLPTIPSPNTILPQLSEFSENTRLALYEEITEKVEELAWLREFVFGEMISPNLYDLQLNLGGFYERILNRYHDALRIEGSLARQFPGMSAARDFDELDPTLYMIPIGQIPDAKSRYLLEFFAAIIYRAEIIPMEHEGYCYLLVEPRMSEILDPCLDFNFECAQEAGAGFYYSQWISKALASISPVTESCAMVRGQWVPKTALAPTPEDETPAPTEERLCVFVNGAWVPKDAP